jgi:hypothetical protein
MIARLDRMLADMPAGVEWVPCAIIGAIGGVVFTWWAVELQSLSVWLQSAGYWSSLIAWIAAMLQVRSYKKAADAWRHTAEIWQRRAAHLELRCRGQNEVIEALIEGGAERSVIPPHSRPH